jgi:uncharacterized protein (TIGR00730 family)
MKADSMAFDHKSRTLKRICVFCGSSFGSHGGYQQAVRELGRVLVEGHTTLVFGGGNVGLMGQLASTVLEGGGQVIGVMPKRIHAKVDTLPLTELHVVENMHQRKAMMYDLSDAFVVLPGGIGTIEEFFEVFTWYQLGIHLKPIGLLNSGNYFDKLLGFIDHMVEEGFLKAPHRDTLVIEEDPRTLVGKLADQELIYIEKL